MNYARVRELAKKKIQAKKLQLSQMSGEDRTKFEQHLVGEAEKEVAAEDKQEAPKAEELPSEAQPDPGVQVQEPKQKQHQNQNQHKRR